MKFIIFFSLFVAFVWHEALSADSPVKLIGNCKLDDLPKAVGTGCYKVVCNKTTDGNITITATTCSMSQCLAGKKVKLGTPDLTKTFPDCCPKSTCESSN